MQKQITTKYVLSEEEWNMVAKCIAYCSHRLIHHPNSGICKTGVKVNDLNKLIGQSMDAFTSSCCGGRTWGLGYETFCEVCGKEII